MKGITGNPALDAYQRFAVKPVGKAPQAEGTKGGPAAGTAPEAAKVSISSEAKALASADAPVNTQKVEALKKTVEDGSFRVDSKAVAERMLDGIGA